MNQAIFRLFALIAVLFALLVVWTSRWTVFEQDSLQANALNKREVLEEQRIPRGPIRARDGTLLARSVRTKDGTYTRRYPQRGIFSQTVGYSFLTVNRFGLEQSYNDELTGDDESAVESVLDQFAGKERVGKELRTTLGQYPPGSTFKVVTAVAAIDSGKYTKDTQVDGSSPKVISGTPLSNFANEQFGKIPLTTALTHSVNTVWAQVGADLGRETMQRYMERFGFYDRAPVDLPPEERASSGVQVPKHKGFVKVTSDAVDLGRVAIGQGGLLTTPLQMANVAAAIANDGTLMRPTLAERVVDRDGRTTDDVEPEELGRVMKPSTAHEVGDMMADVVREGTGTAAALEGISVAGKTGTAERDIARGINTPWFIGFAPRDNPKIAVAAMIESAQGQGGVIAAPIAKAVLQELLK
jgi:peptidoglycan glycosyltransferase